ncbi:hypothetical protein HK097_009599 [Rhizophlyctis rosea]|uniref:Uncharacterized protein n=1 Tax=Rhizophlyctis rosea TaxID=64517 RepID=A0AAD5SJ28_9FUNG|nr:hypothetical protein HK097_009599 [Rhizophlyctis rosea]
MEMLLKEKERVVRDTVGVIQSRLSERASRRRRQATEPVRKDQKEEDDVVPWYGGLAWKRELSNKMLIKFFELRFRSWVAQRILSLVAQYPSGLTEAILYSELELQWDDCSVEFRRGVSRKFELLDSVTDGKLIGLDAVFEVTITASSLLPRTHTRIFTLADESSKRTVDMYLHQKFYFLTQGPLVDLLNQRSIRLTGTRSVTTNSITRLLPTEYIIYLLSSKNKNDLDFLQGHFTSILADLDNANPLQEFKWIGKEYPTPPETEVTSSG